MTIDPSKAKNNREVKVPDVLCSYQKIAEIGDLDEDKKNILYHVLKCNLVFYLV